MDKERFGQGGNSGGIYQAPRNKPQGNSTDCHNADDEHYLDSPNNGNRNILDPYSVPQHDSSFINSTPHPVSVSSEYSAPSNRMIHESISDQINPNEHYSAPRIDNSTPQPITEDQYSVPRRSESIPHHSNPNEHYSAPRTDNSTPQPITEDQYSVPRRSESIPHHSNPNEHYSAPRTDNSTPQPITEDQYSVPRRSESIPHHSNPDEHYSAPRTDNSTPQPITEDQYSVPRRSESIPHHSNPDVYYSAPRIDNCNAHPQCSALSHSIANESIPHQVAPSTEHYFAPQQRTRSYTTPSRLSRDNVYAVPGNHFNRQCIFEQSTATPSDHSNSNHTDDDGEYAIPNTDGQICKDFGKRKEVYSYVCSYVYTYTCMMIDNNTVNAKTRNTQVSDKFTATHV